MRMSNENDMLNFAKNLADKIHVPSVVFLRGDLGAGKTTLTRGMLQAWGYSGKVKSPTFTLVETYELPNFTVNHFDLYRLKNPEELEAIGIRDYFTDNSICIIEWPEKAEGLLPKPNIDIEIIIQDEGREIKV